MKKGVPTFRIISLAVLVLLCLCILVGRLWWLQVARGDFYAKKVKGGSRVTVRLPAVRGEIKDRNGIALAENRASFEVDFYLPDIVSAYKKEHGAPPLRQVKFRKRDKYGNISEADEVDVPRIVKETIIPGLQKLQLEQDYNAEQLQTHFRNEQLIPYAYRQDIDFDTMARMLENNVGLPGLKAEVKPVRSYPFASLAAHILGYVGAPVDISGQRQAELDAGKEYNFFQPDIEGKAQIEKALDHYLRGEPGVRILQRNAKNQILEGEMELVPPKQGADVFLTIDARLQYVMEDTLRVVGRGSAVLVDVTNGDILAMASVPSFDPNKFIPSIEGKDWAALMNDETSPLLNRAINGYAPGSTFKIVTALAGLRAGNGGNRYNCSGGVSYGDTYMKCWTSSATPPLPSHGTLDLEGAIKHSCNAFFFQYGNVAGINQIDEVGNMLGLGLKSGLPFSGENPGILPGPEWLKQQNPQDRWRPGLTANTSIGQGSVLASPVQMAMVTAAVANGGIVYYPRIVDRIVDRDGNVIEREPVKVRANLITDGGIKPEQLEHVRHGMWRVVNESGGTARKGRLTAPGIQAAGKTGTAQNWRIDNKGQKVKDNHTLFIAFAPYDKPKYAICVFIQGGKSGGGVPAPVAAKILDEAFALDRGELKVQVAALEPAVGNFKPIDSIDFGKDVPAATSPEETSDSTAGPSEVSERPQRSAEAPNIREEPDDEGRVRRAQERPKKRGLLESIFGGGKKQPKPERPKKQPGWNPFRR
jgi:penicillin-binding protein 2